MTDTVMTRPRVRTRRVGPGARALNQGLAQRSSDQVDGAIDNAAVRGQAVDMAEAYPEPPSPIEDEELDYAREYQLRLLHRLLMRNLPIDLIAGELSLSVSQVWRLRAELQRRLRNEVKQLDAFSFFGQTMAFYDEVRSIALRTASSDKTGVAGKAAHLQVAISADQAKMRFLDHAGFFDHNRFTPPKRELTDSVEDGRKRLGTIFNAVRQIMDGDETVTHYSVPDEPQEGDSDDGVRVL